MSPEALLSNIRFKVMADHAAQRTVGSMVFTLAVNAHSLIGTPSEIAATIHELAVLDLDHRLT